MEQEQSSGRRRAGHYLTLALVLVAVGAGVGKVVRRTPSAPFRPLGNTSTAAVVPSEGRDLSARGDFVSSRKLVHAHAACLVELGAGNIRAFWYAGTDEGTKDVTIQTAVFDPRTAQWSPERTVASRETTQRALFRYIKKLGNPVAARAADGSLWLFYVTVSVGGWAGSSITAVVSRDDGETWSPARRVVTSPFLNQSTLVKGPPFAYADGTMGLPVHHEFMGKFGELLRLDQAGLVIDKVRLSSGRFGLQPVVMVEDANRALVLMRYAGTTPPKRVIRTRTGNAGDTWTPPEKSPLSNSNAALTGLVLPDGRILVALNDSEENRDILSLVVSSDGGFNWKTAFTNPSMRARWRWRRIVGRTTTSSDSRGARTVARDFAHGRPRRRTTISPARRSIVNSAVKVVLLSRLHLDRRFRDAAVLGRWPLAGFCGGQ